LNTLLGGKPLQNIPPKLNHTDKTGDDSNKQLEEEELMLVLHKMKSC